MSRRLSLLLCLLSLPMALHAQGIVGAPTVPPVPTQGYVLIDHDSGQVLAEQRSRERMEPASITKLMTGYLVFAAIRDKRLRLDDTAPISERAWRAEGSRSFVQLGARIPVEVLIKGMIVQSGNDATIALAERVAGTEEAFVALMNAQAKRLGMTGTNFANSWGGPHPDHYSTAWDLALLGQAIIRDFPEDYRLYSLREFTWNGIRQQNRNGLLGRDPSVDGIKTGHTDSAKYCLVSSARRNGMRLIAVVLGSETVKEREDASAALLEHGFAHFETLRLVPAGQMLLKPRVYKSADEYVAVGPEREVSVTVLRGQGASLQKEARVDAPLVAPLAARARVGEYTVRSGGQVVARVPLVTLGAAPEGGLFTRWLDELRLLWPW
jgi:serine-type D-Ala-D-Ala carboxypeptidase (penicillin-binding protein 5/6)